MFARGAFAFVIGFLILFFAAASRSDVAPRPSRPSLPPRAPAVDEPITGSPAVSRTGNESPARDPFQPYAIGPGPTKETPKPSWSYDDLTDAEKRVADRDRETTDWGQVHDAYNRATMEAAQAAAARAAQNQLGVSDLAGVGVVP